MARPPLPIGTHGSIRIAKRDGTSGSYVAKCRFRDYDGVTRLLERSGSSKAAASRAIQDELRARTRSAAAPLRPEHTFERAAEIWLTKLDAQVRDGARAVTTADTYRQRLRAVILPALGRWRLYECTVPRLDAFLNSLPARHSPESRKTIRTVVSLVLRVAVQHEALHDNPIRHLDPIERGSGLPRVRLTRSW